MITFRKLNHRFKETLPAPTSCLGSRMVTGSSPLVHTLISRMTFGRQNYWLAAISFALALFVYLPAQLSLDYAWDDWELFIYNPALRMPETTLAALAQPILPGTTYFRPLVLASFAAEFQVFANHDPTVSHLINLLIHALNTLVLALIACRLNLTFNNPNPALRALIAAAFYVVHPALIEPVAWISGRFDLMVTLFMLAAMWGYLCLTGRVRMVWLVATFLCAALSKEMAVVLPPLLLILFILEQGSTATWGGLWRDFWRQAQWQPFVALMLTGICYLALRIYFMGQVSHHDQAVIGKLNDPLHHLAFVGHTVMFYMKMAFWPFADIGPQHPFDVANLTVAQKWQGIAAVMIFAVAIFAFIRSRRPAALLFAGFSIALFPVLNIIPLTIGGNIGHERFLTFPLTLLALCISVLRAPRHISPAMQKTLPIMAVSFLTVWLFIAIANIRLTVPLWTNDYTLWSWAYTKHPESSYVKFSYTAAAIRYQQHSAADQALHDVHGKIASIYDVGLLALKGQQLVRTGHPQQALAYFDEAESWLHPVHKQLENEGIAVDSVRITFGNANQWLLRFLYTAKAEAYLGLRSFDKALDAANIALFYGANYPPAHLKKALALYGLERLQEADEAFELALKYYLPDGRQEAIRIRQGFLQALK